MNRKKYIKKRFKRLYFEMAGVYSQIVRSNKLFMNFGYYNEKEVDIAPEDEKNRFCIQLYNKILQGVDLKEKSILEVSCGRGGGAYYFMKYFKPAFYTGVDIAKSNIRVCRAKIRSKNIEFIEGNAQSFMLSPRLFDVVINLEASHSYDDKVAFFANVCKHLKPGGSFIFSDVYPAHRIKEIERTIVSYGFVVEKYEDITAGALKSIEITTKKLYPLANRFPSLVPGIMKNIQANVHSDFYKKLQSRERKYISYVFKKN